MSLPHEIALYKKNHVQPKRRAYEIALAKKVPSLRVMHETYLGALTRYGLFLSTHPMKTPREDEPFYAEEFRAALQSELQWVQAEFDALDHAVYP